MLPKLSAKLRDMQLSKDYPLDSEPVTVGRAAGGVYHDSIELPDPATVESETYRERVADVSGNAYITLTSDGDAFLLKPRKGSMVVVNGVNLNGRTAKIPLGSAIELGSRKYWLELIGDPAGAPPAGDKHVDDDEPTAVGDPLDCALAEAAETTKPANKRPKPKYPT